MSARKPTPAELDAAHLQLEADYLAARIAYRAAQERADRLGDEYLKAQCGTEIRRSNTRAFDGRSVVRVTRCNLRKGHTGGHRNTFADREAVGA
ncbi:hypothetical protein [Leucobacter tenebrionis]|uniref:hypothetical protein n=1 Tax=Leucobacter tenebrionis TaxID=2873270 RepID=UPI001CA655BE|nr:hypothetical protein [Leucobacter tenebrionis]QZY52890.1 hypothetical protein KVY00_05505 [Leucobacter tenebrionis]